MWAKKPKRLPMVLTQDEVRRIIHNVDGEFQRMAQLMYGGGMRLTECLNLRVQDIDFGQQQIWVWNAILITVISESWIPAFAGMTNATVIEPLIHYESSSSSPSTTLAHSRCL